MPGLPDHRAGDAVDRLAQPDAVGHQSAGQRADHPVAARAAELRSNGQSPHNPIMEIHKKFSIPFACLVFGIIALPLGFNNRRGGKSSGFVLSLGVFLVYYLLLSNGENAARYGKMSPWQAMWLPNLVLAVGGVMLLVRRNRDKSLMLSRVDRWIRSDLQGRLTRLRAGPGRRDRRRRAGRSERAAPTPAAHRDPTASVGASVGLWCRYPPAPCPTPGTTGSCGPAASASWSRQEWP